jgi:hypothetical protein
MTAHGCGPLKSAPIALKLNMGFFSTTGVGN